jgi:hypothetical protein
MVNIIENWSAIKGIIISIKKSKKMEDYFQCTLKIKSSDDIDLFPNLAKADIGKNILVNIPSTMKEAVLNSLENEEPIIVRKFLGLEYFIRNV